MTRTSERLIRRCRYSTVSTDSEKTTNFCSGLRSVLKSSCLSNSLNLANFESSASEISFQSVTICSSISWSWESMSINSGRKSSASKMAFFGLSSALAFNFSSISSSVNPDSNSILISRSGAIKTLLLLNMSIMFWLA